MSQLNPQTELKLFFNELLSVFDMDIEDPILKEKNLPEIRERLS